MGRVATFLTILICLDLLFIITGQLCADGTQCSFTSFIFSMALNPSLATASTWFHQIFGDVGSLLSGSPSTGVVAQLLGGITTTLVSIGAIYAAFKSDSILFASAGFVLTLLADDFIVIYHYIYTSSPIVAILIFSPIVTIYIFTCMEWIRGIQ